MTQEEREYFTMLVQGIRAEIKATNDLIESQKQLFGKDITYIKEQTTKTNGSVRELKEFEKYVTHIIDTRSTDCPNVSKLVSHEERVNKLENENITKKEIKKILVTGITVSGVIFSILFIIIKLWSGNI